MTAFHETLFPLDVALGARGGPERRTDIVTLGSNRESRNTRWADSRRRWQAGYGVKTLADLAAITAFFEERRGRLYGFRWRDRADFSSASPGAPVTPLDQTIGHGDGVATQFALTKTYGSSFAPYVRAIAKPVAGSVRIAIAGSETSTFTLDATTGVLTFAAAPANGTTITAGFRFDVPVRFDTDFLEIDHSAFAAGEIPNIPVIEIRP